MWKPNYDQITGWVRIGAATITAWMVGQGWAWASTPFGQIGVVAIVTLGACIWDAFNNKSGKIIPPTLSGYL